MPIRFYRGMADEDARAIVACLAMRSLKPLPLGGERAEAKK